MQGNTKVVLVFAVVIVVIIASVMVLYKPNSSSDLEGQWYCSESERINMDDSYTSTAYEKGDLYLLKIDGEKDGMFYGNFGGMAISGTRIGNIIMFDTVIEGEIVITFTGQYSSEKGGMIMAAYSSFLMNVDGESSYAATYAIMYKDVSQIPVVNYMLTAPHEEEYVLSEEYSGRMTTDGPETPTETSFQMTMVGNNMVRAHMHYSDSSNILGMRGIISIGTESITALFIDENHEVWTLWQPVGYDTVVLSTSSVFGENKHDYLPVSAQLCFHKEGTDPYPLETASMVDYSWSTYDCRVMNRLGEVKDSNEYSLKIDKTSDNNMLISGTFTDEEGSSYYATGYVSVYADGVPYCLTLAYSQKNGYDYGTSSAIIDKNGDITFYCISMIDDVVYSECAKSSKAE